MKAAVFSDTHANTIPMCKAIRDCRPDVVIHLGDHDRDTQAIREQFPGIPLYNVRGNCDLASSAPDWDIVPLGPVKAFICHGHQYDVDLGTDRLLYAAREQGAKLAMYGHTHRAVNRDVGGMCLLNPGTAGKGRELSWALVEVFDNGGIMCSIKEL